MADIEFSLAGALGQVLLNRPGQLNALTHEMCISLDAQLRTWAVDPSVSAVVIRGMGEKAFCAGGDVRRLYDEGTSGGAYPRQFYRDEYRLNWRIKTFPKPYIAILDGIVMGGGVGVSLHGSHRIVSENVMFAMPETGIGLFPDVGGSYFLPRCPGQVGLYLGLTGARLKAADCMYAGLGTSFVPRNRLNELVATLAAGEATEVAIERFAAEPGPPPLADLRAEIDRVFAASTVADVAANWDLSSKSPTALKLAFRQIRNGGTLSFDDCMRMEWRMVNQVIKGHDFYEGVRAVVIDKDQKPRWQPATLAEVDEKLIDQHFAPRPGDELEFD